MRWERSILFAAAILLSAQFAYAGSYMDLSPGVTTKKDADKVLGYPIKEVAKSSYNYAPEKHDARQLTVSYVPETQVIKEIKFYFKKPYKKSQVQSWFKLADQSETRLDEQGNRVEYYFDEGMSLHFDGPSDANSVNALAHFIKTEVMASLAEEVAEETPPIPLEELKPTLGVTVNKQMPEGIFIVNVIAGSAAEKAGLKGGDIILEAGGNKFYDPNIDTKKFVSAISRLPTDKPVRFYIQRGSSRLEVKVLLDVKTPEELEQGRAAEKETAELLYKEGLRLRNQKQWNLAIRKIQEAISRNWEEPRYYQVLANMYYQIGEDEQAIKILQKLIELNPDDQTYLQLGKIHFDMRQYDQALFAFRRAQRMRMDSKDMQQVNSWLGATYYEKGNVDEAQGLLVDAYKKNKKDPFTIFYMASCFDRKSLTRDAVHYYKVYLSLKEGHPQREGRARLRISELTAYKPLPQQQQQTGQQVQQVFDAILKEIGDFNKIQ